MIVLGVDPGSRLTGFGIIKIENKKCYYVSSGCIKAQQGSVCFRLKKIQDGLIDVIKAYKPTLCAVEQVFMFKYPAAALKLGQARGVVLCTLANNNLDISEYSAKQVKQAVVGNGNASKSQVQHMVQLFLELSDKPQEDAADALAIAICHFHTLNTLTNIPQANKIVRGRLK